MDIGLAAHLGDNVMVDYCIQHAAAALEGNISSEARGQVMEMLRNATGYPDRTWSATALLSLDRAPNATWRDKAFVERQIMMLLKRREGSELIDTALLIQ